MTSVEMANLDIFLGYLFCAILKIPPAAAEIYLSPKAAFARLDLIEVAIKSMLVEESAGYKHLLSLHKRAVRITSDRHNLIHDVWGTNPDGQVGRRSIRTSNPITPVPLKQLEQMIQDIRVLIGDVREAALKLERDASAQTQHTQDRDGKT